MLYIPLPALMHRLTGAVRSDGFPFPAELGAPGHGSGATRRTDAAGRTRRGRGGKAGSAGTSLALSFAKGEFVQASPGRSVRPGCCALSASPLIAGTRGRCSSPLPATALRVPWLPHCSPGLTVSVLGLRANVASSGRPSGPPRQVTSPSTHTLI